MLNPNRRDVLKSSAAATAAAGLLAAGSFSANDDDVELLKLWEAYKAQWDAWGVAHRAQSAAEEAAWNETAPHWRPNDGIGCYLTPDTPFSVTYVRFEAGEPHYQTIGLEGAKTMKAAYTAAAAKDAEFQAAYERSKKAARRKYRVGTTERAELRACRRLDEIVHQIKDTPALGMKGLAVKLAVCQRECDFIEEPARSLVDSCYEQVSKLTGTDFAAEVLPW